MSVSAKSPFPRYRSQDSHAAFEPLDKRQIKESTNTLHDWDTFASGIHHQMEYIRRTRLFHDDLQESICKYLRELINMPVNDCTP